MALQSALAILTVVATIAKILAVGQLLILLLAAHRAALMELMMFAVIMILPVPKVVLAATMVAVLLEKFVAQEAAVSKERYVASMAAAPHRLSHLPHQLLRQQ